MYLSYIKNFFNVPFLFNNNNTFILIPLNLLDNGYTIVVKLDDL